MNHFSQSLNVLAASIAGVVLSSALAADVPEAPIDEIRAAVRDIDEAHGHYVRANDFARAMLRIVGEQPNGSETRSAHEAISQAAFGVSNDVTSSGFGTAPEAFPLVLNSKGMTSVIEDFYILAVDPAWMPVGAVPPGTQLFIYSARFGPGPTHVGLGTIVDRWAVGAATGPDEPLRNVVTFFPIDLIDPSEPVTGPLAVQFLTNSVSGAFDVEGALHDWIFEQVSSSQLTDSSSGPSSGCDVNSLVDCLEAAQANLNESLQQLAPLQGQINELEKQLQEEAKDLVEGVGEAALDGALDGVMVGAGGGPWGAFVGALGGAAAAAAVEMIGWAIFSDSDTIANELSRLREEMQASLCSRINPWVIRVVECFDQYCPELANEAAAIMAEELARQGC